MPGLFHHRSEMVSPQESQAISQDSLAASDGDRPGWRKDPTYFPAGERPVIPPPPEVAPEDEAEVGKCSSPWGVRELASIRKWQRDPLCHSLTCPNHSDQPLHVDELELYCPVAGCDYTQDWVPDGVAGVKR